ncbi:MAG: hypothetical protein SNJ71_00345 [Bacteroidales bacterium]
MEKKIDYDINEVKRRISSNVLTMVVSIIVLLESTMEELLKESKELGGKFIESQNWMKLREKIFDAGHKTIRKNEFVLENKKDVKKYHYDPKRKSKE